MGKRKGGCDHSLVSLHRGPQISASALESTLQYVRDNGLPSAVSRRTQLRARHAAVEVETPYGQVLQPFRLELARPGTSWVTWLCHPFALLHRTVRECQPFRSLIRKKLQQHPCSVTRPWSIIIYFDEITPTDPCSTKSDAHKIQGFYWTFSELADIIFDNDLWFIVSCAPSIEVSQLQAGMSQVVKHGMRNFFFNPESHNFETSGLLLDMSEPAQPVPGQPAQGQVMVRLFARHATTICDFASLKELLLSMGQGGLKPCPICINIVKDDLADGHDLFPLSSLETHKFKLHTDQTVRDLQAYLRTQKGRISKTAFGELETRMGYHYNANSVINDLGFKSISTLNFDWAHVYFSQGLFGKELDAFVQLARDVSPRNKPKFVTYGDLNNYVASWTFPKYYKSCQHIFSKDSMAASMSEQLTVAPVLRLFFRRGCPCDARAARAA